MALESHMSSKKKSASKKAAPKKVVENATEQELPRDAAGRVKRTPEQRAAWLREKADAMEKKGRVQRIRKNDRGVKRVLMLCGALKNLGETIEWLSAENIEAAAALASEMGKDAQVEIDRLEQASGQERLPGM